MTIAKELYAIHVGLIAYSNPLIITGCLLSFKNKILLCKRAIEPQKGMWTIPAGFLENQETVKEGAIREAQEEANTKIKYLKLYMMCDLIHVNQVYIIYRGELRDQSFHPGHESEAVKLFDESEIHGVRLPLLLSVKPLTPISKIKRQVNFQFILKRSDIKRKHFKELKQLFFK